MTPTPPTENDRNNADRLGLGDDAFAVGEEFAPCHGGELLDVGGVKLFDVVGGNSPRGAPGGGRL